MAFICRRSRKAVSDESVLSITCRKQSWPRGRKDGQTDAESGTASGSSSSVKRPSPDSPSPSPGCGICRVPERPYGNAPTEIHRAAPEPPGRASAGNGCRKRGPIKAGRSAVRGHDLGRCTGPSCRDKDVRRPCPFGSIRKSGTQQKPSPALHMLLLKVPVPHVR